MLVGVMQFGKLKIYSNNLYINDRPDCGIYYL